MRLSGLCIRVYMKERMYVCMYVCMYVLMSLCCLIGPSAVDGSDQFVSPDPETPHATTSAVTFPRVYHSFVS